MKRYPPAIFPQRVGSYPALVKSGGGYFFDEVLEYRVWVHPPEQKTYYRAFVTYEEALDFSKATVNAEEPLVLISQYEYIDEPEPGKYIHVKKPRLTEWFPDWLKGAQGTKRNIPLFLANKKDN
jgi:hypothetical protein